MSCSYLDSSCPGETSQRRGGQRLLCVLLLLLWGGQVSIFASKWMLPILTKKLIMIMWKRLHLASSNIVVDDEVDGDDDDDDNNDDDWWWWQLPPQLASSAGELLEPRRLPCLHPLQGFFWRSIRLCCQHNERNWQNIPFLTMKVSIECLLFH